MGYARPDGRAGTRNYVAIVGASNCSAYATQKIADEFVNESFDGTGIDVVAGRARGGQHSVDHVVSFEVRRGRLVEVSQRTVAAANMR